MPEQRGLLVARHAAYGDFTAEKAGVGHAEVASAGPHLGQHTRGNVKEAQKLFVPLHCVYIKKHRARGVGVVGGENPAAGQPPYQVGIHRAEQKLAALRPLPCTGDITEYPFELGGRKIGVGQKPRAPAQKAIEARRFQLFAPLCRAAALPHYGVAHGLARGPFPHDCGFALVGYAERGYIGRARARPFHSDVGRAERRKEQLFGVVFHEPGGGIYLRYLPAVTLNNFA